MFSLFYRKRLLTSSQQAFLVHLTNITSVFDDGFEFFAGFFQISSQGGDIVHFLNREYLLDLNSGDGQQTVQLVMDITQIIF